MWDSIVITNSEISNRDIKKIISGEKSAIIIKNFYEKRSCKKIIKKINNTNIENDSKKMNADLKKVIKKVKTLEKENLKLSKKLDKK